MVRNDYSQHVHTDPAFMAHFSERFWAKADRTGEGCWPWLGAKTQDGYGKAVLTSRTSGVKEARAHAHRVAYELTHGTIPEGMLVCHHCDNPPCVRPDHLFLGSQADNNRDRDAKNRNAKGERIGRSKLTAGQVDVIRIQRKAGKTTTSLAAGYGVTPSHVSGIASGRIWAHTYQEKTIVQRAGRARTALKAARGVLLRLTPAQWEAVHAFALRENVTVQGLLIASLDTVFASRGMPFSELKDEGP